MSASSSNSADLTLDARSSYLISGPVIVGNGHNALAADGNLRIALSSKATLTIPAGTLLYAERECESKETLPRSSFLNYPWLSNRCGGNRASSIVFKDVELGYHHLSEWGGLIVKVGWTR